MLIVPNRKEVIKDSSIMFGQSVQNEEADVYTMTEHDFEKLGVTVLTHLGERSSNFQLLTQMFRLRCTALMDFTAFLMIEEVTVLIQELEDEEALKHLTSIYKAFKLQAYSMSRIVVECK